MKRKQFSLILLGLLVPLVLSLSPAMGIFSVFQGGISAVQAQQATPTPPSTLPLSESAYIDPLGRFQVGILEGYNVGFAGNWPLIESPEGDLAYAVVVKARESDRVIPSSSLAQIAIETFERGEGFQPRTYQTISLNEISLPWTGNLKTGTTTQLIQGKIRVRQEGERLLMLLVSATESAFSEIDPAIITVANSLKSL